MGDRSIVLHWSTAIGILKGVFFCMSGFGSTFQKGGGLELVAFADADYASKASWQEVSFPWGGDVCGCVRACAGFLGLRSASNSLDY